MNYHGFQFICAFKVDVALEVSAGSGVSTFENRRR